MPESTAVVVAQINLFGSVIGQETVNRFFYGSESSIADLSGLTTEFIANVIPALQLIMSNVAGFTHMETQFVKGGTDFRSDTLNVVGLNSGDCLPPYVAFDFTFLRGGVGERNGYKRIAGVPESEQVNGTITTGAATAAVAAADAMFAELTPGVFAWNPVIRRTRINRVPQITPKYYAPSGCVYSRIGSQNSRKFGHGR